MPFHGKPMDFPERIASNDGRLYVCSGNRQVAFAGRGISVCRFDFNQFFVTGAESYERYF